MPRSFDLNMLRCLTSHSRTEIKKNEKRIQKVLIWNWSTASDVNGERTVKWRRNGRGILTLLVFPWKKEDWLFALTSCSSLYWQWQSDWFKFITPTLRKWVRVFVWWSIYIYRQEKPELTKLGHKVDLKIKKEIK